ncbi:hypothetical protein Nepgr_020090 [Nepenthes gracilis]|uniref:Prolamin-like domain-containing protein n=1 Tax=Nepenthes gracilis TaxID=150966 RepID=A0AAD3SWD1_NEPGR|nr:hypothetical protein Nepgr_020090 [Nepenthes gracilis]
MEKISIMMALMVALFCGVMTTIAQEVRFEKPDPKDTWYGLPLPPQPRPGYYKFLGECIDKTTQACGIQIIDAIFEGKVLEDQECRKKVVEAGYLCNRALSYILGKFEAFKSDAAYLEKSSNNIFDDSSKNGVNK